MYFVESTTGGPVLDNLYKNINTKYLGIRHLLMTYRSFSNMQCFSEREMIKLLSAI